MVANEGLEKAEQVPRDRRLNVLGGGGMEWEDRPKGSGWRMNAKFL